MQVFFFTIYCVVFVLTLQVFNVKYFFFLVLVFGVPVWGFCYPGGFVICVGFCFICVGFCFTCGGFVIRAGFLLYVWVLFYLCRYFFTCVGFYLPLWVFVLPVWVLWGFNLPEWDGRFRRSSWGSGIRTGSPLVGGSWEGLYIGPATCKIQQHSAQGSRSQHKGQGSKWLKLLVI